jgi:ATP-binding cassette, subfamily B (MDR/TAP), member 1
LFPSHLSKPGKTQSLARRAWVGAFDKVAKKTPEELEEEKKKKAEEKSEMVSYFSLFRYADRLDYILMTLGSFAGICNGAIIPLFALIFGALINVFGDSTDPETTTDNLVDEVNKYCLYFVYLAIAAFAASYGEIAFWMWTGTRQTNRVRAKYLAAVLRQDVAYFDRDATTGKLLQGLNEDTITLQNAISEKVGMFLHNFFTFVVGIAIAFWRGWDLTLIILAMTPVLGLAGALISILGSKLTKQANTAYAEANTVSQQALANIRTVAAFNAEENTVARYANNLIIPLKVGIKQGFFQGLTLGTANGIFFFSYAAALYYGGTRVAAGAYTGGDVMQVLFAAVIGGFALGQAAPSLQYFRLGRIAGASLFNTINMKPTIDLDAPGEILDTVEGTIEFQGVDFAYPSRPDRLVFEGLDLTIPPGNVLAICGESGSGKSTVVQLIQRFYDPEGGIVTLDGKDLKSLQLRWLRSQIGLVSQEPMLFATTIYENIQYGNPDATEDEIYAAAQAANAHDFISALPEGYNTQVGEKGIQMSGGQKQRIAIARAMVRNPKILLLDEATSALDTESEKIVQNALDKLMVGRTTIVVAHRLSTIINADKIAVVKGGVVVEQGTHSELLNIHDGVYAALIAIQQSSMDNDDDGGNDESGDTSPDADSAAAAEGLAPIIAAKRNSLDIANLSSKELALLTEQVEEGKGSKKKGKKGGHAKVGYMRLVKLNKPEWGFLVCGLLSSAALGFTMPFFSLALSNIISVFYQTTGIISGARKWALVFTGCGLVASICGMLQGYCFGVMGQQLARRIRIMMFRSVLHQEVAWFDRTENSSGAIVGRLSADTVAVRGAVGDQMALIVQNLVTVVASYVIAFASSWSMTLVVTATLPVLGFSTVVQNKFFVGFTSDADKLFSEANQIAAEALGSIRTIAAFSLQDKISNLYHQGMAGPEKEIMKRANTSGGGFGFSQFVMFAVYALAFWFGGQQISEGNLSFDDMLRAFFSIMLAAFGLAQAQMGFPDVGKAGAAVQRVFSIIDRKPLIDSSSPEGGKPDAVKGMIEFKNVTFAYPSRPNVIIFKNFNLTVQPGKTMALVGPSGNGKSTVIALIERFYQPLSGTVMLDGIDITTLNLHWLRSQISLVNQEPVLFSATVMENIKYGAATATEEEVRRAANVANALDFIDKLPEGLDTKIGEGGIQLSGGQKQRIAIARAVLKDPRILLLDEATSALDAESERIVSDALEAVMVGRTTVIVAHRLSTIRKADAISVVSRGKIVESGSHDELMNSQGGAYHRLVRAQSSMRRGHGNKSIGKGMSKMTTLKE